MAQIHRTQAIIVGYTDYTERDRLYTFFTREFGKRTILVKGVRTSTSKLRYRLDLLSIVSIELVSGRSFDRLISVREIESFGDIKYSQDQARLATLYVVIDIIRTFLHEDQKEEELFEECVRVVDIVRHCEESLLVLIPTFWIFRLAQMSGLGLELRHCVISHTKKSGEFGLSFQHGGLVSKEVFSQVSPDLLFSKKEIIVLRLFQRGHFQDIFSHYELDPKEKETLRYVGIMYLQYLDLSIRSWPFFQAMCESDFV